MKIHRAALTLRPLLLASLAGALALSLSGCQRAVAVDTSSMDRHELMRRVFPDWKGQSSQVEALLRGQRRIRAAVTPEQVIRLSAGRAVLIAGWTDLHSTGAGTDCHACGQNLRAYWFKSTPGGWVQDGAPEDFDAEGFDGRAPARVVKLSQQRYALAVESGTCWRGYCGQWLRLYELGEHSIRHITPSIPLSADNTGAVAGCEARVMPGWRPEGRLAAASPHGASPRDPGWNATDLREAGKDCFRIQGNWSVDSSGHEPGRLVLSFGGWRSAGGHDLPSPTRQVKAVQRFQWTGEAYAAQSGLNPVPTRF